MTRKQEAAQEQPEQQRRYAYLDGIAIARRATRVEKLKHEIDAAQRGMGFGPSGAPMSQAMRQAIVDQIGQKKQQLATVEALEADSLCEAFAADAIALAHGEVLTFRETLAIGNRAGVPAPPGMVG